MELMIRAMNPEDWNAVETIYLEGINTKSATFQKEAPTYEEWDKSHMKNCRLVAEWNRIIVGWAALSPYSSRCVYSGVAEVSVYVKADCRGQKVGEMLMRKLIEESEAEGIWTLQSGIFEINKASQALHKKMGFRMVGYRERIAQDHDGVWQNTVLMERRSTTIGK
jgi:phosphinothricin acetyltransferase